MILSITIRTTGAPNYAAIIPVSSPDDSLHKILRFLDDHDIDMDDHEIYRNYVFGYEIYDFSSNPWRVLDIAPHWDIDSYQRGASLKGNTYFIAKDKIIFEEDGEIPEPADYILCFDFTTESFGQSLPLPFQHFRFDVGALSSLRDEKLAALYQSVDRSEVEIWVTTMIEPNALSWNPFLKVDMNKHYGSGFQFHYDGGSFFIDEEKKVAVVFHFDESEMTRYKDAAYIIGDDGYVKKVCLGETVNQGASLNFSEYAASCPLVCCGSFVPSLAHLNQLAGFKKEREEEEANQQALANKKTHY
ncbi:PREDICTED: putative F-box protein At3g20030 [Camelina sativa]|uniref:F-box protein At3g20030 n=1 Tax=Camelina sativa TaxID=90675 RepID=A0ABM0VYL4_CAMSA|nr:PREDICTED: putative F-box protein At3g20030 [Camelina sativa]